jgi:hypothetical protein
MPKKRLIVGTQRMLPSVPVGTTGVPPTAASVIALTGFSRNPATAGRIRGGSLAAATAPMGLGHSAGVADPSFNRSALRAVFYAAGVVATVAGLHTVAAGAKSIAGQDVANASVESELRFYAAFYVAYGLVALRVAPRADRDSAAVRALAGALFLAGLARASGWLAAGRPHELQRGLLVIELAAPPAIVAWQARVARRG